MKDRLYYQDAYVKTFTAEVTKRGVEENGTPYVVLSQTAFYPTGGGQPSDHGHLGETRVIDVEEVDGEVRHRLASPIPEETVQLEGSIDWERRFDHMQQHAGQHILSAAFLEVVGAETVAFHLGKERVTIDVRLDELTPEVWEAVEQRANQIVLENRPISARFVDDEELATLPLKKQPTVTENIRVVIIPEFDYNPCGGTHPAHTGEVGMIKILGWERHRGNIRLEFICGWRALRDYTRKQSMVREVSKLLMTSDAELVAQTERLVAERDALKQSLVEKERLLLEVEVRQHLAQADQLGGVRLLEMTFSDRSIQQLQQFAHQAVAQEPNVVCLLAATGEKLQLVFARGAEVNVAVNQLIKDTLPLIDGKGGGNAAMAQGGGQPTRPAQEVLDHAKQLLKAALS
ncbi:DHHA1 domain-containing protein [Brevibacillus centrosporus]|uniref:alanyl-tRNA editing protein n=1 Tax=Brevibacillus centrosporus TaxID=54910 RepID=UPI000F09BD7C|nr:DHHA1 domain-containing protein [Brevibacillus centrosporus]MEC2133028.1 DHHA1 domain-containing protein [Brevibacillus centrosporus]RNB73466.1 alanyl-tRNA editing protein [Brevibacillus centrosporus]GED31865.1 alanyl-tRNA editing protein [Brevibacillus centrosporus]